jgi:uncharacterized protein YndB with AHSA1/START domain
MAIHHEVVLPATPERVYTLLTDGGQFASATGNRAADIGSAAGATFSLFGGAISGRHIELVPNQRVVQAWRPAPWEPGVYSVVRFTLVPEGGGTRLVLDHTAYPEDQHEHLSAGWTANYFDPFARYLAG